MSFLDLDERLAAVESRIDLVYSPLVDAKEFPQDVDVTLVEGAVGNEEEEEHLRIIRDRTKILVSFGDCAVTANVVGMRNQFKVEEVLNQGYRETVSSEPGIPHDGIPRLLKRVRPLHEFVRVDVFLPGCPPLSDAIFFAVSELLDGRIPDLTGRTRFGA